jgi:hypothetical protein
MIIVDKNVKKVTANFNKIEIRQVGSRVDWTNISFLALGTVSRGRLEVIDDADVNISTCTFTDMDTFIFKANSTLLNSTFRRCGLITQGSAVFTSCTFDSPTVANGGILSNNPANISYGNFISDGAGHAIEINTPGTYAFNGNQFTGYGATGTTDAAIYNNSGGVVTLNIGGGGSSPTYRNGTGASTTINAGQVTLTLTGLIVNSEVRVYSHGTITELAGIEDSGTSFAYSYTYTSGTYVDIVVHKADRIYYRIDNYLLGNADASLPVSQQFDRQYSNP